MIKYIGQVYRITAVKAESTWFNRQEQLVGYKGKLIAKGTDQFYTLALVDGPLAGRTVSVTARIKLIPDQRLCYCRAYRFPHRQGSGKCYDNDENDQFCSACGKPCTGQWQDTGIGPYEFWGEKCTDSHTEYLSDCCEADVCGDASLTYSYDPEKE